MSTDATLTSPATAPARRRKATRAPRRNGNGNGSGVEHSRALLSALNAARNGDFSATLDADAPGINGQIAEAFNSLIERNRALERELERLNATVGRQGKLTERASLGRVKGGWASSVG